MLRTPPSRLGFGKDAKNLARYRVSEVKNGRLAMLAISGILTQAAVFPDKVPLLHRVCSCVCSCVCVCVCCARQIGLTSALSSAHAQTFPFL